MMSSNGNIFRVTGLLCGEFTGPRWIPRTKASALMFSLICVWINGWVNNREAGDLRWHRAHYDVTVMIRKYSSLRPGICFNIEMCYQCRKPNCGDQMVVRSAFCREGFTTHNFKQPPPSIYVSAMIVAKYIIGTDADYLSNDTIWTNFNKTLITLRLRHVNAIPFQITA